MAADFGETLDLLEKRVTSLERRLLTNDEDVKKFEQSSCLLRLVQTQHELNRLSSKYSSIANAWGKMKELETYLSPEFLEKVSLSDDAKADIIIAGESQIKHCADQLKEVEDLKKIVNTEPLKDLPTLSAKLEPLVELQLQQQEENTKINERLSTLLIAYNNIINVLSKQFIQWDGILSQMEQMVDVKPAE